MNNPLKEIRQEQGSISRIEMSRRSGISYQTLTVIENGMVNTLRETTLNAISEFSGRAPHVIQEQYIGWKESLKA